MRPDRLEEAIEEDLAAGLTPAFVTATVGTTSTTAVDPVPAIAEVCRRHGAWLHVDAAYAGIAALLPEMRWINAGLESADSYCTNPHKWMLTNFDCTAFYVADRAHLIETLSVLPEYLRNTASESGSVIDYRDWQIPLGRRFRALKLWFVIRSFGIEGLRAHVASHIRLADHFASLVEASADFEVVTDHPFGLVCFRHRGGDEVNQRIMDTANQSGKIYLTHTRVADRLILRSGHRQPQDRARRHRGSLAGDHGGGWQLEARGVRAAGAGSSPSRRRIIIAVAPHRISPSNSENHTVRPAQISDRHAAGSSEALQCRLQHHGHLAGRRLQFGNRVNPAHHRHHQESELDGVDRLEEPEDGDVPGGDAHLLLRLTQGGVDCVPIPGWGRPPGKARCPAWVGMVSGRLVRTTRTAPSPSSYSGTSTAARDRPSVGGSISSSASELRPGR